MLLKYKDHILILILLTAGIFASSELLADRTLTPRFLSLFIILSSTFLLSYKKIVNYLNNHFNIADSLLLLFCLWQLMSIIWSTNKAEAYGDSFKSVALFGIYLYLRSLLVSDQHWKSTLPLLISMVSTVYLILTWINMAEIQATMGLNAQSMYLLRYPSGNKNLISIFLLSALSFQLLLLKEKTTWKKILAWTNITGGIVTLFILTTRAVSVGILAFSIFFFIGVIFKKINRKKGLIIAVTVLMIASLHWVFSKEYKDYSLKSYDRSEITKDPDLEPLISKLALSSVNERLILWKQTFKLISEEPVLGLGAGNWKIEFPRNGYNGIFRAEFFNTSFNRPHNDFLWVFSEFGIIGFLLFTAIIFMFLRNAWHGTFYDYILIAGILAYLAASCFDFPRERSEHTILFAAFLAILAQAWNFKILRLKQLKFIFFIALLLLIFGGSIYSYRFIGEKTYLEMRRLKNENKHPMVIKKAAESENIFYTTDYVNFPLKWYRGISYTYMGKFKIGEKEFREALKLNPNNFHTLNNLGFCLASQEKYKAAIPYFLQALKINEHFEDARFNLSFSYMMNKQFDKADEILQKNIKDKDKKKLYIYEINRIKADNRK